MKIALDDFGTGFASLSHLKRFPVDVLKIDRSFVQDLQSDEGDAAIVRAVVQLGKNLNIEVVAEGVETPAQEEFLRMHGCDYGQGFRYGKAVPGLYVPLAISAWGGSKPMRMPLAAEPGNPSPLRIVGAR